MASGLAVSRVLSFSTTGRKRLRDMTTVAPSDLLREDTLVEAPNPALRRLSLALPKSPKEMGRLRRRLAAAGYYDLSAAIYFSAVKFAAPVVMAGLAVLLFGFSEGWMMAAIGATLGYLLPDLWLNRKTRAHGESDRKRIARCSRSHHRVHRSGLEPGPGHRQRRATSSRSPIGRSRKKCG